MIPGMNDNQKKVGCKVAEGIYVRGEWAGGLFLGALKFAVDGGAKL